MTATASAANLWQYKIKFSFIAEQILAFASYVNMVKEVKNSLQISSRLRDIAGQDLNYTISFVSHMILMRVENPKKIIDNTVGSIEQIFALDWFNLSLINSENTVCSTYCGICPTLFAMMHYLHHSGFEVVEENSFPWMYKVANFKKNMFIRKIGNNQCLWINNKKARYRIFVVTLSYILVILDCHGIFL